MKKKIRIIVDCGMTLLLPLLMAYSLVGEAAHEYLGIGMFLLFVAHHILNIAWWKHIFRGKYTLLRVLGTVINLALAIIMLALPISGMILSRHVFRFMYFGGTSTARTIHLLASYWGLVLMSLHAGIHGNVMMGMFRKAANMQQPSKIRTWSLRAIAVLLVVCGCRAFVKNKISSYLFLRTQFVFIDFSQPVVLALLDNLAIVALFAVVGYYIRKTADAIQQNRGVIERRQAALYQAFAQLLQQRDEADGVCRLMQETEYDQKEIEDLLE